MRREPFFRFGRNKFFCLLSLTGAIAKLRITCNSPVDVKAHGVQIQDQVDWALKAMQQQVQRHLFRAAPSASLSASSLLLDQLDAPRI
jgi:hypothetical protein